MHACSNRHVRVRAVSCVEAWLLLTAWQCVRGRWIAVMSQRSDMVVFGMVWYGRCL